MPAPPPIPASRRRFKPRNVIFGFILLVAAIAAAIFISFRLRTDSANRQFEARIRQRNEPLTLAELAANYPAIPDQENAAVALMDLWQKEDPKFWEAFRNDRRPLPKTRRVKRDPKLPYLGAESRKMPRSRQLLLANLLAASNHLAARAEHLRAVREALQRPGCRFLIHIEDGGGTLLPHLARVKTEAQEFRIESLLAAEEGRVEDSVAALENVARVGNLLDREPDLIGHLVRRSCMEMVVEGLEQLVCRHRLSRGQIVHVRKILHDVELTNSLRSALVAERALNLSFFVMTDAQLKAANADGGKDGEESEPVSGADFRRGMGLFEAMGLVGRERHLMFEAFEGWIAASGTDYPADLQAFEAINKRVEKELHSFPPSIFTGMLLPAFMPTGERFATQEAHRRAAILAVAVEEYRLSHGDQPPEKVADLVPGVLPEIPVDPFDGQPVRYVRRTRGYVTYSIGSDLSDDGGHEPGPGRSVYSPNVDLTFVVER